MSQEDDRMIEALLASEREAPGMPDEVASRLASRLGITMPTVSPASPPTDAGSSAADIAQAASGWTLVKAAQLGTTLLVGAALGVGIDRTILLPQESGSRPAHPSEEVIAEVASSDAGVDASGEELLQDASLDMETTIEHASVRRREAQASLDAGGPSSPRSRPRLDDVDAERLWLERAEAAFGRGDAASALGALDVHRRRFPNAILREERDALHVRALYLAGRRAEGTPKLAGSERVIRTAYFMRKLRDLGRSRRRDGESGGRTRGGGRGRTRGGGRGRTRGGGRGRVASRIDGIFERP